MVEKFFHLYCFIIISIIIFYDFLYHDFWGLRLIYTAKQIQCGPELKKETDHLQIKQHGPINTADEVERIDIRETHGSNSECLARDQPGCHLIYNFFCKTRNKAVRNGFSPVPKTGGSEGRVLSYKGWTTFNSKLYLLPAQKQPANYISTI
jgi:hypothetical protein